MQPSRFIVIRDYGIRKGVHRIFEAAKRRALDCYTGAQAERYSGLKLEGILEAPQDLRVLCDPGSERLDAADSQGDDHRHESDGHVVVKLLTETPTRPQLSQLHSRSACAGRRACVVWDSLRGDGVDKRLLDSRLPDPGSARS